MTSNVSSLQTRVIEDLFDKLMLLYGRAWTSLFPTDEESYDITFNSMLITWHEELKNFNRNQIFNALDKYKKSEVGITFPPNPLQLASLCNPSLADLGLPEPDAAYDCAIKQNYVHPAIYHSAMDVGSYNMRHLSDREARKLFLSAYRRRCYQVSQGEQLEMPQHKALPAQVVTPASENVRNRYMGNIKEMLQCKKSN